MKSSVSVPVLSAVTLAIFMMGAHGFVQFSLFPDHVLPEAVFKALLEHPPYDRFLAYGGILPLSVLLLWNSSRQEMREFLSGAKPFLLFLGWAGLSLSWSVAPGLGSKKLVLVVLGLLFALATEVRFKDRELLMISLVSSFLIVYVGLLTEVWVGGFHPWEEGYRFSGLFQPNQMAANLVVLLLSLLLGLRIWPSKQASLICLVVPTLCLLVLTGSRTMGLAMAAAVLMAQMHSGLAKHSGKSVALILVSAFGIFLTLLLTQPDLSGRGPLWRSLLAEAGSRPLVGFGYGSFWSLEQMQKIWHDHHWAVPNAHSQYLDILLSVGIVGFCLFFYWFGHKFHHSLKHPHSLRQRMAACHFTLFLVSSLTESFYNTPMTPISLFFFCFCLSGRVTPDGPKVLTSSKIEKWIVLALLIGALLIPIQRI